MCSGVFALLPRACATAWQPPLFRNAITPFALPAAHKQCCLKSLSHSLRACATWQPPRFAAVDKQCALGSLPYSLRTCATAWQPPPFRTAITPWRSGGAQAVLPEVSFPLPPRVCHCLNAAALRGGGQAVLYGVLTPPATPLHEASPAATHRPRLLRAVASLSAVLVSPSRCRCSAGSSAGWKVGTWGVSMSATLGRTSRGSARDPRLSRSLQLHRKRPVPRSGSTGIAGGGAKRNPR